jgi:hypothetical protein
LTALGSRNAEVVFLAEFALSECGVTLDSAVLGQTVERAHGRIRTIQHEATTQPKPPDRPLCLIDE